MTKWLIKHAVPLQAVGSIVTMLAAVAALIGVKVQIDASARQQREQSARDIYREYLNLSISRPEFARPNYCAIAGTPAEPAYDDYLEYLLYTSEQVLRAMPDWEPTLAARLMPHKEVLCSQQDWSSEAPEVQAMIARFKDKQCKSFASVCE